MGRLTNNVKEINQWMPILNDYQDFLITTLEQRVQTLELTLIEIIEKLNKLIEDHNHVN